MFYNKAVTWLKELWYYLNIFPITNIEVKKSNIIVEDSLNDNYEKYIRFMKNKGWIIGDVDSKLFTQIDLSNSSLIYKDYYYIDKYYGDIDLEECCSKQHDKYKFEPHLTDFEFHEKIRSSYRIWRRKDGKALNLIKHNPVSDQEIEMMWNKMSDENKRNFKEYITEQEMEENLRMMLDKKYWLKLITNESRNNNE